MQGRHARQLIARYNFAVRAYMKRRVGGRAGWHSPGIVPCALLRNVLDNRERALTLEQGTGACYATSLTSPRLLLAKHTVVVSFSRKETHLSLKIAPPKF